MYIRVILTFTTGVVVVVVVFSLFLIWEKLEGERTVFHTTTTTTTGPDIRN
jgi:hypothetical protein